MREKFPHYKAGDRASASHLNKLSDVARRVGAGGFGNFQYSAQLTINGTAGSPPSITEQAEVSEILNSQTYKIKIRYYSEETAQWKTSETEWTLDASDSGAEFQVGAVLQVYYHRQRGLFLPVGSTSSRQLKKIGVAIDDIEPGEKGWITIWRRDQNSELNPGNNSDDEIEAYHDWITNDEPILGGDEVFIEFFADEYDDEGNLGIWRITGAECHPNTTNTPPIEL